MGMELIRELYKMNWKDKPDDELMAELRRISEIAMNEPIHITKPTLYEKFMALGEIFKARRGMVGRLEPPSAEFESRGKRWSLSHDRFGNVMAETKDDSALITDEELVAMPLDELAVLLESSSW